MPSWLQWQPWVLPWFCLPPTQNINATYFRIYYTSTLLPGPKLYFSDLVVFNKPLQKYWHKMTSIYVNSLHLALSPPALVQVEVDTQDGEGVLTTSLHVHCFLSLLDVQWRWRVRERNQSSEQLSLIPPQSVSEPPGLCGSLEPYQASVTLEVEWKLECWGNYPEITQPCLVSWMPGRVEVQQLVGLHWHLDRDLYWSVWTSMSLAPIILPT